MYPDSQNILVINIAGLAQSTLALPALRSLRIHYPRSRITVVSSAVGADLLRLSGCADEVLQVGRLKEAELFKPGALFRTVKVWKELRRGNYDLAIEFKPNTESGIVMQLANPSHRLTRSITLNKSLGLLLERFTRSILQRPIKLRHDAHEYLKLLEPLGVRPIESEPRIKTDRASDELVEKLLRKEGVGCGELLVGIHPGTGAGEQRWPLERFASIASRMIHNFNARVIVFSGPNERGAAKTLAATLPAGRSIVMRSPKLADFLSAAARLSLFISHLGGPAHVVSAVGAPVVALSVTAGPSPQDLLGGHHEHVRGSHVDLISEEAVYEAACRLLKISRADFLRTWEVAVSR